MGSGGGGGGGKPTRWKLAFLHHRSPATSSPTRAAPNPPAEFVCPISGRLMADPVILPSGLTFDRPSLRACQDLGVAPPGASSAPATDLPLIPNMALKTAIYNWCDSLGLQPPPPLDPPAALHLVRGLFPSPSSSPSSSSSPSTASSSSSSYTTTTTTTTAAATSTSSSSSSEGFSCDSQYPPPKSTASTVALEEDVLARLRDPRISEHEAALLLLRSATRDGGAGSRAALCTPRILAALRPALLSRYPSLQSHASASLVNLSLHPPNRARVVRSGVVPGLVNILKGGGLDAQDHAAAALFSLAVDDDNKAAIGALGALPPLLHFLSRPSGAERARRDAAMALYHLSMAGTNRSKLVKLGAVRTLLELATRPPQGSFAAMPVLALMILCNLAPCGEGREAMMEAGAVEALVGLLRAPPDSAPEARREHCVTALYWMSRGSMRFRGLARAAGAKDVLRAVVEQEEAAAATAADAAENGKRWRTREMAKRALHAAGEADDDGGVWVEAAFGGVSELALRARRRPGNSTKC